MNQVSTVGLDLAKHIFQLHGADSAGAVVFRKKLRRGQVLAFLATLPPCTVAMEAYGSAHYWGREIAKLGHTVTLIAPAYVKMLWGGGDGMARSPPEATDGAPHATAERLEPVTCCSEPGRHLNRDHRDEPIKLARRRHRPWDRAPPAEEAHG